MISQKDKVAYTRNEAAAALGLDISTINRACKAGDLHETHPRIGGKPLARGVILADELKRWAEDAA
jgi:hypothetical protein